MLKSYIKKIVKTELAKQKLNHIYGSKITYDTNYDYLNELVSHLNGVIHQQNSELSKLYSNTSSLKQENELLKESIENLEGKLISKSNLLSEQKEENVKLKNIYSKEKLEKNKSLFNSYGEKYEIETLKKELLDSKNGLNGANHVIKNNKEWINQQDKKIKELESKNKGLEDKFQRIYKTIEENYYQDGYYELLRIKNIITEILKES